MPDLPLVRLVLPPRWSDPVEERVAITLPPAFLDSIGPEGIEWDPRPDAAGVDLQNASDGRTLSMNAAGRTPRAPIEIEFTRPRIRPDEPGEVVLRIADPRRLRAEVGAGDFEGRLIVKMFHPRIHKGQVPIQLPIPIEVTIPGHRLLGLEFQDRLAGRPLTVGASASLEVLLESVGVGTGSGTLRLDWRPEGAASASAERLLQVPLPLPVPVWDPHDARSGWFCHARWGREAILAPEIVSEARAGLSTEGTLTRHRIGILLPDLFAPGEILGRVEWTSGPDVDEAPRVLELDPIRVGSGIWAGPRLAVLGESVRIAAIVSRRDCPDVDSWGDRLPILRSGPGVPLSPGHLERLDIAGTDVVTYVGEIQPGRAGEYRIAIARDAPASAVEALRRPLTILAPLQVASRLPVEEPMVLFKGPPPIYWVGALGFTSEDGADHELRRSGAMIIQPVGGLVEDVRLRLRGVFQAPNRDSRPGRPLEVPLDPRVRIVSRSSSEPLEGSESFEEWEVSAGEPLHLDFVADIHQPPPGQSEHPNQADLWLLRWVVSGRDANGRPVARVIQQPFALAVSTDWDDFLARAGLLTLVVAILVAGLLVLLTIFIARGMRGTVAPVADSQSGAENGLPGRDLGMETGINSKTDNDLLGASGDDWLGSKKVEWLMEEPWWLTLYSQVRSCSSVHFWLLMTNRPEPLPWTSQSST